MLKIQNLSIVIVFFLSLGFLNLAVAEANDFTGNWQGSWTSYSSDSGALILNITQSGTTLSGKLTIKNTDCGTFSNLDLSGSVSGNNIISIDASAHCPEDDSDNTLRFINGTLNGNSILGEYSVYSDGEIYDSGTYSLTRAINIITASAGAGGIIVPSGEVSVNAGSNKTFEFIPDSDYKVLDVTVDGASVGSSTSYTFTGVSANHRIAVTFTLSPQVTAAPWLQLLLLGD